MAGRGGKREGAGRPPGTPNKVTSEKRKTLREIADTYTDEAIATLAEIMADGQAPHAARVTAANAILDRGHGKPKQPIETELDPSKLTHEQLVALALALGADPAAVEGDGGDHPSPLTH